jgi:RNA polymerase sigma factor (sigma-70 family)
MTRAVTSPIGACPPGESEMTALDPLADSGDTEPDDHALVERARGGEREALEALVARHQRWIYNVALRMLYDPQDAQDATQEILMKALTALASFQGRSSFRTWLYRIAANHVLNVKRGRRERAHLTFSCYAHALEGTPDLDPPDEGGAAADVKALVEEARIGCTAGMLLCLDRPQRLVYILGEIFEVGDAVGAELLEISRDNFRQRLARARRDLHSFMNDRCGLVNAANPCRCARKTRGFIEAGYVDPHRLLFANDRVRRVREVARQASDTLRTLDEECAAVFRDHPFHDSPDLLPALRRLLGGATFRRAVEAPEPSSA